MSFKREVVGCFCLAVEKHGKCEQEGKTKMKQKLF